MSGTENAATHSDEDALKIQASEPATDAAANGNHNKRKLELGEAPDEGAPVNKKASAMLGDEVSMIEQELPWPPLVTSSCPPVASPQPPPDHQHCNPCGSAAYGDRRPFARPWSDPHCGVPQSSRP